jgi:hypothetical protein
MPSKDAIFISKTMCPINLCGRPRMSTSHMCVHIIFFPSGRLMCSGFVATQMLLAGAPAITNISLSVLVIFTIVKTMSLRKPSFFDRSY